ncbi:unnamed protein product, partial [Discosporangium mesarthrocarpum]
QDGQGRGGYKAVVGPVCLREGLTSSVLLEAMEGAWVYAEDTLTRFVKSSEVFLSPDDVERKKIEVLVRELVNLRPYSTPSQRIFRSMVEETVKLAEAPYNLTANQCLVQIRALAKVLTEGYQQQMGMVEEGQQLAAARIQGLARGTHTREIVRAIWRRAEAYAVKVVEGERASRRKAEELQRQQDREKALQREREEVERYRLRMVPRVSSTGCRELVISLPPHIEKATLGITRFLVMEVSLTHPVCQTATGNRGSHEKSDTNKSGYPREDLHTTPQAAVAVEKRENIIGFIRVLLRQVGSQGAIYNRRIVSPQDTLSPQPDLPVTRECAFPWHVWGGRVSSQGSRAELKGGDEGSTPPEASHGQRPTTVVSAESKAVTVVGLRPCTTYRLSLKIPWELQGELLQSARRNGVEDAVRSLEAIQATANVGCAGSSGAHLDVSTRPDVPEPPRLVCKV